MNKDKSTNILEYLSLTLILSYLIIHEITLVVIGIVLSLYIINKKFINNCLNKINQILPAKKDANQFNRNEKNIENINIKLKLSEKEKKLSLVETIEELGFIPSLDKNHDNNCAWRLFY